MGRIRKIKKREREIEAEQAELERTDGTKKGRKYYQRFVSLSVTTH